MDEKFSKLRLEFSRIRYENVELLRILETLHKSVRCYHLTVMGQQRRQLNLLANMENPENNNYNYTNNILASDNKEKIFNLVPFKSNRSCCQQNKSEPTKFRTNSFTKDSKNTTTINNNMGFLKVQSNNNNSNSIKVKVPISYDSSLHIEPMSNQQKRTSSFYNRKISIKSTNSSNDDVNGNKNLASSSTSTTSSTSSNISLSYSSSSNSNNKTNKSNKNGTSLPTRTIVSNSNSVNNNNKNQMINQAKSSLINENKIQTIQLSRIKLNNIAKRQALFNEIFYI